MGSFVFVRYFCSTSSGCRKQKNNGKWAGGRNKVILEHNEVNFGLTETRLLDAWVWDLGNWDYTNGFSFYNFSFFVADPPTILVQEPWIHTGETSTVQLKCQICSHNPFTVRHLHLIQFLRYCNISFFRYGGQKMD